MLNIFPFEKLGNHNYGWLNAHYHFNFADYFHSKKMGYPPLLVWNDDQIKPGTGFPMHSHQNMEIITYVRKGAITHEDSLGNKGVTRAGEIQIMSAGTGITHSEYNAEETETHLFQIWIQPNMVNIKPGSILEFEKDKSITCEVVDETKVKFREEIHSLSASALIIINEMGYDWTKIHGPGYWMYKGKTLSDLRNERD